MKAQKNSGRGQNQKGDATQGRFLVDIKEYNKSFSVSRENWAKICTDAWTNDNRFPCFLLVLGEAGKNPVRLRVIEEDIFNEMKEAWEEKYGTGN